MKTIKMMGGLGNQMFQYAHALSLKEEVQWDLSWYKKPCLFPLLIDKAFSITLQVASSVVTNGQIKGYFQGEKFFRPAISLIRAAFKFNKDIQYPYETPVAVHIRRTDRVTNEFTKSIYGVCSKEYFEKAMTYMARRIENPTFIIVTDDYRWAREIFPDLVIISNDDPIYNMLAISKCHHHIISNSTFGWWGAWLSNNLTKLVVAPKNWYVDGRNENDVIPEEWIRL